MRAVRGEGRASPTRGSSRSNRRLQLWHEEYLDWAGEKIQVEQSGEGRGCESPRGDIGIVFVSGPSIGTWFETNFSGMERVGCEARVIISRVSSVVLSPF